MRTKGELKGNSCIGWVSSCAVPAPQLVATSPQFPPHCVLLATLPTHLLHIITIRQAQVLLRGHIAQQGRACTGTSGEYGPKQAYVAVGGGRLGPHQAGATPGG